MFAPYERRMNMTQPPPSDPPPKSESRVKIFTTSLVSILAWPYAYRAVIEGVQDLRWQPDKCMPATLY